MTHVANDAAGDALRVRTSSGGLGGGLFLAVVSATSFGMSGSLARGLLSSGWSPGAIVLARIGIAALVVAPFAAASLRGRWHRLRAQARTVLVYGVLGLAGAQFCFFSAVTTMDVAPALLIEYTAPAAVVAWLWARRGLRPRPYTLAGAGMAAVGLVPAVDLISGADLAWSGVAWALAAMVGLTAYFLIAADTDTGLPPVALTGAGLMIGTLTLAALAAVGLLPMHATVEPASYATGAAPWWLPVLLLGVVTAALAYTTGTAASRRLGARTASFVALLEIVASVGFAWLLIDETPTTSQTAGGLLIIGGVILAELDDHRPRRERRTGVDRGDHVAGAVRDPGARTGDGRREGRRAGSATLG
ncbi:EamA family transporter [Embleya scabrispora]|uniref:EamA family transporter n=1 Tax=Embleya scabrispora TaxID=159449 RepID=UPI000378DB13|nr:DMT family transporter [Embleya scabrispora]MYS86128.1 EamA family transporter [Streptomyces sp. SID5474]